MPWIKRNLLFVISGVVVMALLGLAGYYMYAQWSLDAEKTADLEKSYADLTRIANLQPNPGNDKVDNTVIAKEFQDKVRSVIAATTNLFIPVAAIPAGTNVSAADYSASLRRTVDELTRNAANSSVSLQPKYDFSFAAQRPLVKFAAGSLEPLAAQLGEVKAICDVLFKAKINTLYNLRRTRVSDDDLKGPQSDYLETTATTNELAVLVPYEVTFYGFSGELAAVLSGFANEPHGFIVTALNIEPGTPSSAPMDAAAAMGGMSETAMMERRNPYGNPYAAMATPGVAAPAATAPGAGRSGSVMLDERQLKVTMGVSFVKLLPKK
jgi:hypothetical protein